MAEGVDAGVHQIRSSLQAKLDDRPDITIRSAVLVHVVRGGRPSYVDRMMVATMGEAAVEALIEGYDQTMVAWDSPLSEGIRSHHARVSFVPLAGDHGDGRMATTAGEGSQIDRQRSAASQAH